MTIKDTELAIRVIRRVSQYLPGLSYPIKGGAMKINMYQLAKRTQVVNPATVYPWMKGSVTPSGNPILHLLDEVLAYAESDRAELRRLKGEVNGNGHS